MRVSAYFSRSKQYIHNSHNGFMEPKAQHMNTRQKTSSFPLQMWLPDLSVQLHAGPSV